MTSKLHYTEYYLLPGPLDMHSPIDILLAYNLLHAFSIQRVIGEVISAQLARSKRYKLRLHSPITYYV